MAFILLILLITFFGYLALSFLGMENILEKLGLSFLVGLLLQTLGMFFLNVFQIKLNLFIIYILPSIFSMLFFLFVKGNLKKDCLKIKLFWGNFGIKNYNFVWLFLLSIVLFFIYASVRKSLFWPTFNFDAVHNYVLTAKLIVFEGTCLNRFVNLSAFTENLFLYPLLPMYAFSLAYFCGLSTVKIVVSLLYINFIFVLYNFIFRYSKNRLVSILTVLFVIITPEMYAFSSLTSTNMPLAFYTSLSVLYCLIYFRDNKKDDLILSCLMLCGSVWIRNEAIAFVGGIFCILLYCEWRKKRVKRAFLYLLPPTFIFILWQICLFLFGKEQIRSKIFDSLTINFHDIFLIFKTMLETNFSLNLFGLSFWFFTLFLGINIKKNQLYEWRFLEIIALMWFFYGVIFYFSFSGYGRSLESMLRTIRFSSYKRIVFIFIPLFWFYIFNSFYVKKMCDYFEKKCCHLG